MVNQHELREIELLTASWADAELRGDHVFLNGLLADDFTGVGPLGFLLTKDQWLERYRSGGLSHTAFTWSDATYRFYGDSAIAVGRQSQQSSFQGRDANGEFRVTQVFARIGGAWRLATTHLSSIAAPNPTR
jgi:ketosteroid isomerase-like protein